MRSLALAGAIASAIATSGSGVQALPIGIEASPVAHHAAQPANLIGAAVRPEFTPPSLRPTRDTFGAMMRAAHNVVSRTDDDSIPAESIVGGLRIRALADGAGYLTLEDGTEWKIALADRPRVDQWKPGDHVIVKLAPIFEHRRFRYTLVNGRDGSEALAAFNGRAQASD